ncbi:MYND-type domain-containing protein [Mycena venus]|uniref:MYND-type domain-containing protein n=1 Tax=Mycena venus TaxID=2733690 RepID=A0A8H6YKF1_9AGAR|nr:MYND-type domain-containing protein [Mycena venus]
MSLPLPLSPSLAPADREKLLASIQRHLERNERARLRMARKRAELKLRPVEEQERAAERSRVYRARYRQKHHQAVLKGESERRRKIYIQRYGEEAYKEYAERRERRQRERDGREAPEH